MRISFLVVFSDGKLFKGFGSVVVYPYLDFKTFQSILSSRIGISSDKFSTYLVDQKMNGKRLPMIPITAQVNFANLSRQTNGHFLVTLLKDFRIRPGDADLESAMGLHYEKLVEELGMDRVLKKGNLGSEGGQEAVCKECKRAKEMGREVEFHCCVNDPVTFVSGRSKAGPIARPVKGSDNGLVVFSSLVTKVKDTHLESFIN